LSTVKKYGEHQNAKKTISSPHSTKMPRSRMKTRTEMERGMSWPVAAGPVGVDGGRGAAPGLVAPVAATSELVMELNFRPSRLPAAR
jgi:hypothetical protein